MRPFLFFILWLAFNGSLFCQGPAKVDSMLKLLPTMKDDSMKVKTYLRICNAVILYKPKDCLRYGKESLALSKKISWGKGIPLSYYEIGIAYDYLGDFSNSYAAKLIELDEWKKRGDKLRECMVLGNLAAACDNLNNYTKAMEFYLLALKTAEAGGYSECIMNDLCNIGTLYVAQSDTAKALDYFFRSLALAKKNGSEKMLAINYLNIGTVYSNQRKPAKALEYFNLALPIEIRAGEKAAVTVLYLNIGTAYKLQADSAELSGIPIDSLNKKVLRYYFQALQLASELGNSYYECIILINIGDIYFKQNQFKKAEDFFLRSADEATLINSAGTLSEAHRYLYALYKAMKLPEKSLFHLEQHHKINDSIFNETNKKIISELEIKYETKKKETENKTLAQQNKILELSVLNKRYLNYGLAALLAFVAGLAALLIRQDRLRSKQIAVELEQKLLRAQMNPHFIFNSLANIESFIYSNQPKEAGDYFSRFARLMRLILENSASEYITLEKEIETLEYYLALQKLRLDSNLHYSIETDPKIYTSQVYLPPMLTQPFIENAIEHGFRGITETGCIKVSFIIKDQFLYIEITDNGIGIVQAQQQKDLYRTHKSMAMQITRERLKFINKSKKQKLIFKITELAEDGRVKGTKIVFAIPL